MRIRKRATPQPRRSRVVEEPASKQLLSKFSYGTPRQPQAQPAARASQRAYPWWQRLGLILFLVAATALAVNVLSLSPSAKIVPLANKHSQPFLRPPGTYEAAANQLLKSSVWNRTKVTVDTGGLSRQMLARFPELNNVSLTVPLLSHRPLVYIEPSSPALVLSARNGTFVVDTAGKALQRVSSTLSVPKAVPVLSDQSGLYVQLSHQVLPVGYVKFIQVITAELANRQFTATNLVLPAASNELDVSLQGQSYFVKFNLQSTDPRGEAGTFLATLAGLKRQNIVPARYIDVRVNGRAYYQ